MEYQQLAQDEMIQIAQTRLHELEAEHFLLCIRLAEMGGIEDTTEDVEDMNEVVTLRRSFMHQINVITIQIENAQLFLERITTKQEDAEDSNDVN